MSNVDLISPTCFVMYARFYYYYSGLISNSLLKKIADSESETENSMLKSFPVHKHDTFRKRFCWLLGNSLINQWTFF